MTAPLLVVTAAVIERSGAFLVTRRLEGTHLAGHWEFPGGKCEPGESHVECLEREILEELDARACVGAEIFQVTHDYPERTVELHFFACTLTGDPRPVLGQEVRWVRREELRSLEFPPADNELVEALITQR